MTTKELLGEKVIDPLIAYIQETADDDNLVKIIHQLHSEMAAINFIPSNDLIGMIEELTTDIDEDDEDWEDDDEDDDEEDVI